MTSTKYTYAKVCASQTCTCANSRRRSGQTQETTRSDQEVLSLTEANMKDTWPVDLIAVAKITSLAKTWRAGLGTMETTWGQDGLLRPVEARSIP